MSADSASDQIHYDVIILGKGPAGLQAAVHASRAKARVAVLGRIARSSLHKAHVENYCCMGSVMSGEQMLAQGRSQAEGFGAGFMETDVVELSELPEPGAGGRFAVTVESGETLFCHALILAMGISRNRLNIPGEKALLGKGVSYCVDCDGNFYRGEPVAVAGNGSAAATGALTLLMIANEVHLIYRDLEVDERLKEQVEASGIIAHPGRWPSAIHGQDGVERLTLDDGAEIAVKGVFIELGAKGALEIATRLGVAMDQEDIRFIGVDRRQRTSVDGVFAAGDICGPPWQMAKAIGEGCVAGLAAAEFVRKAKGVK